MAAAQVKHDFMKASGRDLCAFSFLALPTTAAHPCCQVSFCILRDCPSHAAPAPDLIHHPHGLRWAIIELWQQTFLCPLATPAAGLFLEGCHRAVTVPYTVTIPCLLLCFAKSWNCSQSPSQGLWAKWCLSCKKLLVFPFWSQESPSKVSPPQRAHCSLLLGRVGPDLPNLLE